MTSRAQRRRAKRAHDKHLKKSKGKPDGFIHLSNPESKNFETFVVGNVCYWQKRFGTEAPMVEVGSAQGKTLVICGAGPSLKEHAADHVDEADEVWGCNSAMPYLHNNGHRVTHGFCVDQTPHMLTEWESLPPVEYMVASTVHPHLVEFIVDGGRNLRFFHNYVGIKNDPVAYCECGHDGPDHDPECSKCDCTEVNMRVMDYEDWLYHSLYPPSMRAGSGLNSVTRAIDVGWGMGFEKITVLGADCAIWSDTPQPDCALGSPESIEWLEATQMHADGGSAIRSGATPVTMQAEIDGRYWVTKPDMAVSAMCLIQMKKKFGKKLQLIGDTFPNAMMNKPDDFLERLPNFVDHDGKVMPLV